MESASMGRVFPLNFFDFTSFWFEQGGFKLGCGFRTLVSLMEEGEGYSHFDLQEPTRVEA